MFNLVFCRVTTTKFLNYSAYVRTFTLFLFKSPSRSAAAELDSVDIGDVLVISALLS